MMKLELCETIAHSKHHPRLNLSNASLIRHEICTPLAAIMGAAYILKNQLCNPEQQKQLDAIFLSGKRLLDITNQLCK